MRLLVLAFVLIAAVLGSRDSPVPVTLRDVTADAGITFRHDNAASPEKYLIETMGAGAAWIDYDGDGHLDIYFANSAATRVYKPVRPLRCALYRSNGDGTFRDVTASTGTAAEGLFGMGVAVGDYDNDGDQDLYVIGYGRSILYRNEGNGRFTDVTGQAGTANTGKWGSSGAWFDYDGDGRLDLVIANYVEWSPSNNLYCGEQKPGYRSYCHPNKYKGQSPTLLRNRGDGGFEDVTEKSGLARVPANGLGVVTFDSNGDGWMDILIANDSMQNSLFLNRGNGTFEESAVRTGVAFGENGEAEAGMGIDAADYDGDGLPDVFITHLDLELNRLYRNRGGGIYEDRTMPSGLGYQAFQFSGFGVRFIDYDNDGWRDLFIANGHVLDNIELFHPRTTFAEPKIVFRNQRGRFENVTARLGPDLLEARVSRAAAFADYDNDGDIDVLVTNNGQDPQLLRNEGGSKSHWLQVHLTGTKSNRDAVGAKVTVRAGALRWTEERKGGMSYQAAHDPRLHFGLGEVARIDSIEVRWPSGAVDRIADVTADRLLRVVEGAGAEQKSVARQQDADAQDGLGVALAEKGDIASALPHFEAAVQLRPGFAEAHYHLGLALDQLGRADEAIVQFQEALKSRSEFPQARYQLAGLCRKRGDLDGAIRLLTEIARAAPEFAEVRYNLGLALQARNRLAEAVDWLREAVGLDARNVNALLALGVALAEQQKPQDAEAVLRRAVAAGPANPETHYNLGLVLATGGRSSEAEAEFRAALRVKTDHASARRALGVVLMHEDRLDEALAELRSAIESAPADAEAVNNLGLALLRMGDRAGAIEALEQAVRINPNLIKAHNTLAQAYQRAGRVKDAKYAAARAAELTAQERGRGRSMVLIQSASQRLSGGDAAGAIAQLREAIQLSPSFADAHYHLGAALRGSREWSDAEASLRTALALEQSRADAHYELGLLLEQKKDLLSAVAELQEAVRLAPCWLPPREALVRALLASGQDDRSRSEDEVFTALGPARGR